MSKSLEPTQSKQQWLAQRLKQAKNKQAASGIIPQVRPQQLPLSFAQQRLWFLEQWDPGNPTYLLSYGWRLSGPLNRKALEDALTALTERHETLRTAFPIVDGQQVQVIYPVAPIALPCQDLTTHPESTREDELQRIIHSKTHQPFDLTMSPLWRGHLIRRGPEDHMFLLIFHHIITDGWSMGIVLKELSELYAAHANDRTPSLPPLPLQYADFAIWQRQWLQGDVLDRQLSYWRTQLAGVPPTLELPTDFPRPSQQTYRGHKISFTLPPSLTQSLKTLSQQESVTLFMTMLAAFQLLLARYSGQRDVLIGTPIAGRTHTELEGMIGFFVNTLVLRLHIQGQPTFREVLRKVRETCLEAYAHQDLPFEKLVEALQPVRDPSRHPLFQVMFQLFTKGTGTLDFPGITLTKEDIVLEIAKFDLNCTLQEQSGSLRGTLEFNSDLFFPHTIQRLIRHYQQLLEGLVANPNQPVHTISLLTDEERRQQLSDWNDKALPLPQAPASLTTLFEAQVAATPDAVAVVFEEQQMTYREINRQANQLAHFLQAQGVGPEVRVGLYLDRSIKMLTAVLGILKAGGAYVPLDPTYPEQRLQYIVNHSHLRCLLTQSGQCLWLENTGTVPIELEEAEYAHYPTSNPVSAHSGQNLAYVIYTSGSTGTPKGVMVTHQAVLNLLLTLQEQVGVDRATTLLAVTSLSFDISVFEILGPLIAGGRLVLTSRAVATDGAALLSLIQSQAITLMQATPSTWSMLLQSPPLPLSRPLQILTGGEALTPDLAHHLMTYSPSIWNVYGPTETTIWSTIWKIDRSPAPISIGRPLGNTTVFLVDQAGELVPVSVTGEMLIGGMGVARGYFQRPDLTAAKFIPDSLSGRPGSRIYKTGDLARYRPDGLLAYLGRRDHQVKVRGFRIELGEIEAWLIKHPSVREAIVVCREDTPGDKKIVAYVVPVRGAPVDLTTLRADLGTRLPDYMLPSACVILDRLPLTPNGKVDRQALPVPDPSQRTGPLTGVPPRNPIEELIADIWRDLLKVEQISVHDNFFELGGHSLLATQVMARLRHLLPTEVSLRTFFDGPTIAQLSGTLKQAEAGPGSHALSPLCPQECKGPPPLSFAQQRLWFLEQWMPGNTAYLLPYAWNLTGPLDVSALEASLTALVARHASLRTACSVLDGQPVQVIGQPDSISLFLEDLSSLPSASREEQVQRAMQNEQLQPFDLSTVPLWRGQLLRLGPEEHVLLLTLHHLITDGWSMRIFFQELSALYQTQITGKQTVLPALPLQYADFSIWQRQWIHGEVLERQISYWRTQLANAPPTLDMPTDFARPSQISYRGGYRTFTLSPALTHKLNVFSRQEGVTLFMSLLAAFQLLLARHTGQWDILVGTPIAGRTHTELEGLIGFFVNTLVLRTRFTGRESFRELVRQVRETCVQAYTHQDLPFEKLVETLQPVRDPSRHPLFQVIFQLHQADSLAELTLENLEVAPIQSKRSTAKFDLSLGLLLRGETLHGTVTFNTELFESETITHLITHYQMLLESLVAAPTHPVCHLPILPEPEKRQLLAEWNPPLSSEPLTHCVHDLFDAQATSSPESIAVVCEDQYLTYSQLTARSNQLAHFLRQQGVKPEVRVGVYLERGVNLIISFLAILKAGGAYVPLDPSTPPDRLRFILENAGVAIVLTSATLQERLTACFALIDAPSTSKPLVIDLDNDWAPCLPEHALFNQQTVHAENLAYVMYTSGSTGQPKGVSIPHRAIVRLIYNPTYIPWPSQVTCLQLASPSFDAATFEIWACLIHGGKLVLAPHLLPSFDELGRLLQEQQISLLWLTAGLFHQLVDWNLKMLSPVHTLLAGGDVLSPLHVQQIAKQLPTCQLVNGYGPTENTTFTCCFSIPTDGHVGETIPIGRPIPQTQIYVLDNHQELMPLTGAGELYIGGLGLARGYQHQPGLTAAQFIPHPFSLVPGARLYRSGDIGRHRKNGTIEFLGRRDHQVKIRGYRIECGEIETVLTMHPAVREVIVLPREDGVGNKRLVAYIVLEGESAPPLSELRDFLGHTLPAYMIPSGFVFLDAFPLTPNGKVNRDKLALEDEGSIPEDESYQAPGNSLEEQLTTVWEAVLGKKPIGITHNFFSLGGESLMAVRLCSEMERLLGKKIPVSLIFHAQTIKQLAHILGERKVNAPSSFMVPIQTLGNKPPIFCVLFGATFLPYMKNYLDQPLYMFINQGHDGRAALHTTVEEISERYLQELRRVQPQGPYYLAGYSFGGMVAFEMAQTLRRQGETIALLALVDPTTTEARLPPQGLNKRLSHLLAPSTHPEDRPGTARQSLQSTCQTILRKARESLHWRWQQIQTSSCIMFKELICMSYCALGYPISPSLRRFYRDRVVKKAAKQYCAQYYAGRIVLFQTKKTVENYWGPLCTKVDHIYNLSGGHLEIVDEPHTETLLHLFMECLEKAQKNQKTVQESPTVLLGEYSQ
ncbi:MAG: amino acid adenylation domain-containing protein [Nitrospirales bacterium]